MTAKEFFVNGTEPTEQCDCHVSVKVCAESGQRAGSYCTDTVTKTYLASATEGTEDAAYVLPEELKSGSCEKHRHFWSNWGFRRGDPQEDADPYPYSHEIQDPEDTEESTEEEPEKDTEEVPEEENDSGFWGWLFGN